MLAALRNVFNARTMLVAVLVGLASTATAYYYGRKHMKQQMISELARENELAQSVYQAALRATAEQIAGIEIVNTTVRQELEREIHYETKYRECRHDDDTLRLLNAVLAGEAAAEPVGNSELPATNPAQR